MNVKRKAAGTEIAFDRGKGGGVYFFNYFPTTFSIQL